MAQQPERATIGPVQVVGIKEQRLPARDVGKHLHDSIEEEQALFVCGQLLALRKRAESRVDLGSKFRDLSRGLAENLTQVFVVLFFAYPATKCFDERKIRRR